MSAHCTISPSGPPFSTLGLKTSPDSSVRKPTCTRICKEKQDKSKQKKSGVVDRKVSFCHQNLFIFRLFFVWSVLFQVNRMEGKYVSLLCVLFFVAPCFIL